VNDWKERGRKHWKEFRPKLFRALKKEGKLEAALDDAVERTRSEMAELQAAGYKDYEAWEIVRESYLFVPEEGKKPAQDSPLWRPSDSTSAASFLHQAMSTGCRTIGVPDQPIQTAEQLKKALKGD